MRRLTLLIAACGIVMACADEGPIAPTPPPPPPPLQTFVVFGTVQDEAGVPLSGAVADLVGLGRSSISNDSGYFSFTGVRGPVTVRVGKDGYEIQSRNLNVTADIAFNVKLLRLKVAEADSIVLGQTIRSTVDANAPPCDPIRWDAFAPCRRFGFTAPFSGVLVISISWSGEPELDATMMTPNDTYLATSRESGFEQITLVASVEAGVRYEIRVNSYYGAQEFGLRADLTP